MAYTNILNGIKVASQQPLEAKRYVVTLAELSDLGVNNVNPFQYYEYMIVSCAETERDYVWREVVEGDSNGLLVPSFTYPDNVEANGIDYSNRTFNFFKKTLAADELPGEDDGIAPPIDPGVLYTWDKFADDANGANMTNSPDGKTYIGLAINKLKPESQDPDSDDASFYFWTLIGDTPSYTGPDGKTYYIWTKYGDSAQGAGLSDSPDGKAYIGLAYNKESAIESEDASDYDWSLILGDTIQPPVVLYYWVKFASSDNPTPEDMSDSAEGKTYMGIATDKESPIKSNDPSDYVWNLITGDQGYPGADGKTYYVWVKYANSNTPLPEDMFDEPSDYKYMGIVANRETAVESLDYTDYSWSKTAFSYTIDQNNKIRTVVVPANELTSFDDAGLAAWLNANYVIVNEDEIVALVIGADSTAEIPILDLGIPLDLILGVIGDTTTALSWNPNGDTAIVRYSLYYNKTGGAYNILKFTTELDTTLLNLEEGTDYRAHIVAYDTEGNSKESNEINFTTTIAYVPSTPIIEVIGVTDTSATLKWSIEDSFGATSFDVYKEGILDTSFDTSILSHEFTGLTPETAYTFKVQAQNGIASNFSNDVIATTLPAVAAPLTAPTLALLSRGIHSVEYSIAVPILEVSRVTKYEMQYRVFNQPNWIPATIPLENLQTLSGLVADTSYQIQVRTVDDTDAGDIVRSDWSTSLLATTQEERGVEISMASDITQPEYEEGWRAVLRISNGTPDSVVRVNFEDIYIIDGSASAGGEVTFKESLEATGFLKVFQSNRQYLNFDLTLDSNGEYRNAFSVSYDGGANESHNFTMNIIQSVSVITIGAAALKFINGIPNG